jgi:hypothetical protein
MLLAASRAPVAVKRRVVDAVNAAKYSLYIEAA